MKAFLFTLLSLLIFGALIYAAVLSLVWRIIFIIFVALFLLTVIIYWFNLENRLIYYFVHPMLKKHYDNIDRDRRL